MWKSIRTRSVLRSGALAAPAVLAATLVWALAPEVEANLLSGGAVFRGASQGQAVPFSVIALPSVVEGAHNGATPTGAYQPTASPGALMRNQMVIAHPAADAFLPSFQDLVTGLTVIKGDAQMEVVWNRLFDEPYNAGLFDFETGFVVLVGGGQMHPYFGFDVTTVERYTAQLYGSIIPFDQYSEEALAMVATTSFPGPKPPEMDPVYKVSAVEIAIADHDDIMLNRQVFAAP